MLLSPRITAPRSDGRPVTRYGLRDFAQRAWTEDSPREANSSPRHWLLRHRAARAFRKRLFELDLLLSSDGSVPRPISSDPYIPRARLLQACDPFHSHSRELIDKEPARVSQAVRGIQSRSSREREPGQFTTRRWRWTRGVVKDSGRVFARPRDDDRFFGISRTSSPTTEGWGGGGGGGAIASPSLGSSTLEWTHRRARDRVEARTPRRFAASSPDPAAPLPS